MITNHLCRAHADDAVTHDCHFQEKGELGLVKGFE